MTEQTFKSPGFFEREVDLTQRNIRLEGIPAGVIGTANQGPAFVPVTLGSFSDFESKFGSLSRDQFGPFAVREWLKNRSAVTFIRVLGAGAANSEADISQTVSQGTVKNAGFIIKGTRTNTDDNRFEGSVQFIAAQHTVDGLEVAGYPAFSDNQSFNTAGNINLIRAMVLMATGAKLEILDYDHFYTRANTTDDLAEIRNYDTNSPSVLDGTFKLVLSSSDPGAANFGNDEGNAGIKIYTASLDPTSEYYIGKFLNTNPDLFSQEQHLLYADFPVESEIAKVTRVGNKGTVGILSGSTGTSSTSGLSTTEFRDLFGRFDTRYQTAKTTSFISQPFGNKEYDLFHFESLSDGESGNRQVKVSISNIRKSSNRNDPFGTFAVLVRDFEDSDTNMRILEQFSPCNLNPSSENYIANVIGDYKVFYNFDAESEDERRLNVEGKRPNKSRFVRIVMNQKVEDRLIPQESLPFGFRGIPLLKTTDNLTDDATFLLEGSNRTRLNLIEGSATTGTSLITSILPPVPFRFKATRGKVSPTASPSFTGYPSTSETSDARFFWGVKFESIAATGSISDSILKSNIGGKRNKLIDSYTKFLGIQKLDTLLTGSGADEFNNNKFTLARVALQNTMALTTTITASIASAITGSADEHIRETAYIRNGEVESKNYTVTDTHGQRITFATLAASNDEKFFNRFSNYAKFTNIFYGGFDGLNILDKDQRLMNDRAASSETGGKATSAVVSHINLHADSAPGASKDNNVINSYRTATRIITDPFASRVNIVAIPGIKDPYVTDFAGDLTREYSKALYIMDIPSYDDNNNRIFSSTGKPNVRKTVESFDGRRVDNNYVATYFPDVVFDDDINRSTVNAPASVAALKALGYNDSVAFPWFAPAGFNRGALDNVLNTRARLNTADRDLLYESRINPIATFPNGGFVIFGQKTLQQDRSSLDRVNVRRTLLEVKRIISDIASKLIFEQNTPQTRARFVAEVTPQLATIQANQGIEKFEVVMDSSNNSQLDIEQNRVNGRIVLVPTRAVEFIAIDFIVTNSGVSFE